MANWSASSQFGFLTSFFSIYNIYLFISVSSNTTVVLHTLVIKWSDLSSPWTSRSFTGHSVIIWKCHSKSSQKLFAFYYYFCYFPYKQITMNVVLQIQSVTTMPSVRIITVLMFVLVKLGLQEMEKHVMVRWAQLCQQIGFIFAVRLFSNGLQMNSKCGKQKQMAHKAMATCFTGLLMSQFWHLLWSEQPHGNMEYKEAKMNVNDAIWASVL